MKTETNKIFIYTDGASKGNPGLSGIGIAIYLDDLLIIEKGYFVGILTNNQAEYLALIIALEELKQYNQEIYKTYFLHIHCDSLLLVKQLEGSYAVKNVQLKKLFKHLEQTLKPLLWTITHIFREYNTVADKLANKGINEKLLLPDYLCFSNEFIF